MIPLRDANPTSRRPVVTIALIAICVAVYGLELWIRATDGTAAVERFVTAYGAVGSRITEAPLSDASVGLVTSQFLHDPFDFLHLIGNMLYLWIFGNNIEDRLGRLGFLAFYLAGGVLAALAQIWMDSSVVLIGASGAIAATLGAYLVLYPRARVLSLIFLGFFYQLIEVPALAILALWFAIQVFSVVTQAGGQVAFFAHIGGFVAGAAVGLVVRAVGGGDGPRPLRSPVRYGVG